MDRVDKLESIVTKQWLKEKAQKDPAYVIGRALVAIFYRQTEEEKASNSTSDENGIGFSANDARIGSIGAKYFMKHGTLTDKLLKSWIRIDRNGYPRICKYAKQLNNIANENKSIHARA